MIVFLTEIKLGRHERKVCFVFCRCFCCVFLMFLGFLTTKGFNSTDIPVKCSTRISSHCRRSLFIYYEYVYTYVYFKKRYFYYVFFLFFSLSIIFSSLLLQPNQSNSSSYHLLSESIPSPQKQRCCLHCLFSYLYHYYLLL